MHTRETKDKDFGRPPTAFLYQRIAIPILLPLVARFFRMKGKVDPRIAEVEGPIVAVGHHTSYLDQFAMGILFGKRRVNFVAGSFLSRNRFVGSLFKKLGVIPKTQFRSDSMALKAMLKVLKRGGVLGIFPEATRFVDGTAVPFDDALARLIKKTNSAVVTIQVHGGYSTWPRWSESGIRKGYAECGVNGILTVEQVKEMSVVEVQEVLLQKTAYNEYDWLRENPHTYKSKAIAAGVENVAFICPACRKEKVMRTEGNRLFCSVCGNEVRMNSQGFFEAANEKSKFFEDLHQWVSWEREQIGKRIDADDMYKDCGVTLLLLDEEERYRVVGRGSVSFSEKSIVYAGTACEISEGLVCTSKMKKSLLEERSLADSDFVEAPQVRKVFDVAKMRGVVAQYGEYFELIEAGGQVNRFYTQDIREILPIQMMLLKLKEKYTAAEV